MRYLTLLMAILLGFCSPATAGEYQEKPVMCGSEEEIFPILRDKEEILFAAGNQLTKVRDPDESDGIALNPAILPFAMYVNLDKQTYTVLEYHKSPYNVYCIISFGNDIKIGDF